MVNDVENMTQVKTASHIVRMTRHNGKLYDQYMEWDEVRNALEANQGLFRIRIVHPRPNDWHALIDFLRSTDTVLAHTVDGITAGMPEKILELFVDHLHSHELSIHLGGITMNCALSNPEMIELTFSSLEIDSEDKARVIFRLMSTIGRTLKRSVLLIPDNKSRPIFSYEPGSGIRHFE